MMPMLALRFMMRGTEKGRFSPMTLFAWAAIGVGVAAMSSLLSVMYGFEGALKERVLNAYPHIMVRPKAEALPIKNPDEVLGKLYGVHGVTKAVALIETEMIIQSDNRTLGGVVYGYPQSEMARFQKDLQDGKLPDFEGPIPSIVLGTELARRLHVDVGSKIRIFSPTSKSGMLGMSARTELYEVSGLYASGHYEYDQQLVLMHLADAQDLLRWPGGVSGFHVWTSALEDAEEVKTEILPLLPSSWKTQSWAEFNSALFSSLKLEQLAMFLILTFAILIAVMNIVITLMMHVSHKRVHIGVLRAMGASSRQVRHLFIWQGAWMGLVGLLMGAFLTTGFVVYVRYFSSYQLPEIYYDRSLPIELRPLPLMLIYVVATLLIFIATLYPALKASQLDPIEAIRE